jgi:Na+-driven multidrug efflux pump
MDVYLTFTLILGILCEIVFIFLGKNIISSLYNLNGESLNYAYQYLIVAGPTVLFNLWIFIFSCYFRSNNNTKIQAKVTFISLLINLILDYTLVFGILNFKGIGIIGCAVGTTIGLLSGLIMYLINYKEKINLKINIFELKKMVKLYFPLLIDELFNSTIILVTYAYSSAALTKTLQTKEISYQKISIMLSLIIQGITSILIIVFSSFVTSIITNQESIINIIHTYMILGISTSLIMCLVIPYKEALQGFNCEKFVALITIIYVVLDIIVVLLLKETNLLNLNNIYLANIILNMILYIIYKIKSTKIKYE